MILKIAPDQARHFLFIVKVSQFQEHARHPGALEHGKRALIDIVNRFKIRLCKTEPDALRQLFGTQNPVCRRRRKNFFSRFAGGPIGDLVVWPIGEGNDAQRPAAPNPVEMQRDE